ncbi:MAG: MauE/DoxX family redox-associated membrane protein [Dehalococcoidia bacterium]
MKIIDRLTAARLISNDYCPLGARLFLGATFIVSAVTKLPHHTEFVEVVKDYDLLPGFVASAYAQALPWVELFTGVYVLLAIFLKPSAVVAFLMGISFFVANTTAIIRGEAYCGSCFGQLTTMGVWHATILDTFILIASLFLILQRRNYHLFSLDGILSYGKPFERTMTEDKTC